MFLGVFRHLLASSFPEKTCTLQLGPSKVVRAELSRLETRSSLWHQWGPTTVVLDTLQIQPSWGHPRAMSPVPPSPMSFVVLGSRHHPILLQPPLYFLGIATGTVISSFSVSSANGWIFLMLIVIVGLSKLRSLYLKMNCFLYNGDKPRLIIAAFWDYLLSGNCCTNSAGCERERWWGSCFRCASIGQKLAVRYMFK